MTEIAQSQACGADPVADKVVLRLYLAGEAPNSILALRNLKALCEERFSGNYSIEVVDVLLCPERAWKEGIIVTPMTVRVTPAPSVQIVGNLANRAQVLRGLGL
jgi:circadian clock protein KaiB